MEIWRDIKGYEGIYQISNKGRVKSLNYRRTGKEKILKPGKTKPGYLCISLYKKGEKCKCFSIHRLVAQAFLPNPDNLPIVNHKDENKLNNNVENLEWCNSEYNLNYGNRNERVNIARKKHRKKIVCVESNEIFNGSKDIFDKIINCCENNDSIFGLHFKYIDE